MWGQMAEHQQEGAGQVDTTRPTLWANCLDGIMEGGEVPVSGGDCVPNTALVSNTARGGAGRGTDLVKVALHLKP